ncbi:potassium channel family protein [Jidongwangia harbinensis]|uniref:potassium channel family protein n=1 Tax=Jidongwangia harbinensis TaxID=2878561 RepID=UPI001CD92B89|nr:potassium channel family protein [Jidongwangia harbinensis]MCA2211469.1 two pore domain potassium channel family protein [Jidongwangia harbinensis]
MRERPARHGYGPVLTLIVSTYVLSLVPGGRWLPTVLLVVQAGTVWLALRVSRARRSVRLASVAVFALALVAAAFAWFAPGRPLTGLTFLAAGALYLVAPISIVRDIGVHRRVDRETMLGALAAYLLIGMAFGFAYACVAALQPGPLFGDAGDPALPQALFFSFVTLTTTGYGDLVPATNPAQSIAVLEALLGTLFLVTAVSKVVENWRPRGWRDTGAEPGDTGR